MNMIRHIIGAILLFSTSLCPAAEPQETVTLLYGATTYSAEVADMPESRIKSDYPELLRPPSIGDKLTYRVDSGTNQLRRLIGMVVASNKLVCIDGPEIRVDGGTIFDLLYAISRAGKMLPSSHLELKYLSFGRPKPHVVFPPGDYWTPEEKRKLLMDEQL